MCSTPPPPTFLFYAISSYLLICALFLVYSTRVSNELGAGDPETARLAVGVVFVMAITEGILVGSVLILIRNVWGYAYSDEVEVIRYVAIMMPILAVSNFLDGLQCVLSGFSNFSCFSESKLTSLPD
jgi:MATE family multidrug resistance protein